MKAPPQPESIPVASQTVVTFAVKNNKLSHYPRRDNDVIAYYKDHNQSNPEKPEQIRWVVRDMAANQHLEVRAKNPGTGIFGGDLFVIAAGYNSITSGAPLIQPGKGQDLNWPYSVHLMENGREVDQIDPMVIIKNDP